MVSFEYCRRPQQARQAGGAGGQGTAGGPGHRSANKEPMQPAVIPVAKSTLKFCYTIDNFYVFIYFF